MENSLTSVDNLKHINSTSKDNVSLVVLELEWGCDITEAVNDVRSFCDMAKNSLPDGCSSPMVFKFSTSTMPICQYSITADVSYPALDKILNDEVIPQLNQINGIGNLSISGAPDRYVYIDIDQEKLDAYIEQNRKQGESNATDRLIKVLLKIPGLVRLGVNVFKLLDRFGLLPRKILKASPFHCTMCISNLASIRLPHIFHHCYNFGTTSVFITLGNQRENMMRTADGIEPVRCLPLGVVMDERICSGSYFGMAFKQMKKYLANPELMEGEPTFELFSK